MSLVSVYHRASYATRSGMVPVSEGNYNGGWVLAEQRQGELQEVSLELVCWGRKIADKLNEELCALLFGDDIAGLAAALSHYGTDTPFLVVQMLIFYPFWVV
jgi:hypothetical protein